MHENAQHDGDRGKIAIVTRVERDRASDCGAPRCRGVHMYLIGWTTEAMDAIGAASAKPGARPRLCRVDVRGPSALEAVIEGAAEETGLLDVIVNSAGLGARLSAGKSTSGGRCST